MAFRRKRGPGPFDNSARNTRKKPIGPPPAPTPGVGDIGRARWETREPVSQETCCCGARVVIARGTDPVPTLESFRQAHRLCREAWAQAQKINAR